MPSKGHLAKLSRKRYGPRPDGRRAARQKLFKDISPYIHPKAKILSDQNPHYAPCVRKFFPKSLYTTTPGKRGCITGQGELKKAGMIRFLV